jgi:hypothetical protein
VHAGLYLSIGMTRFSPSGFSLIPPGTKMAGPVISMVKNSNGQLSGFVKMRTPLLLGKIELAKNCTATMGIDSRKSIWVCN